MTNQKDLTDFDLPKQRIGFYSRNAEYGWLSNFWRAVQTVDDVMFQTNEHYYQTQKALNAKEANWIRASPSAWAAMKAGRALRPKEMKPDWDNIKLGVMLTGLRAKFSQNEDLTEKLLSTGDAYLFEDSPTDSYWGAAKQGDGNPGHNHLGRLLMQVREELRNAA